MDILSYLTTLIKTHKEVGIPGLGTIYKRKSPGRYDINTHSFLPPSYSLSFTSDLKELTLLSELISKKKNISVDAATYFVEQFSQNILDELSGHQESDFGDLGTFSTTSGSLTFVPKQESNLGFDFYGLPTLMTASDTDKVEILENQPSQEEVHPSQEEVQPSQEELQPSQEEVQPLQEEEQPIEIEQAVETEQPQVKEEQLELENNNADLGDGTENDDVLIDHLENTKLPAAETPKVSDEQPVYNEKPEEPVHFSLDYTGDEKSGMPAYLKVIIGLVALIILAGIIYLAKPELFNGMQKKSAAQPVVITDKAPVVNNIEQIGIDSIAHADSIRRSNEKAILAADSAKDSIAAIKRAAPVTARAEMTYEIIAASLLNQKEADNFLADMKAKGIPAKIANMPGRRVKISIGSFTDEDTAKKELEVLKKTTKIPGIYIYKVRHTNNPK